MIQCFDKGVFLEKGQLTEAAPAPAKRGTRKAPAKRGTRKKASTEPQEELNSPAFDNFEGVDFDS